MTQILITVAIVSYVPAFYLLAFLWSWRWLLWVGGAALLLCALLFVPAWGLESYAGLLAGDAVTFFALGLIAGFLSRAGALKSRHLTQVGPQAAFAAVIFVLVPALFCGTVYGAYRVRENLRAPTLACASALHQATLGDMRLALPTAPNLVAATSQWIYGFGNPEDITRFCTQAATAPPALISVRLVMRTVRDRSTWFCAQPRDYDWWLFACRPDRGQTEPDFPGAIEVFVIERSASTLYARPQEELKRIQAGGRPLILAADGFRRYGKDDQSFFYVRDDDTSYIAACNGGTITKSAYMSCAVARELAPHIGMTYRFGATDDTFAARARMFDAKAAAFVASLKASP